MCLTFCVIGMGERGRAREREGEGEGEEEILQAKRSRLAIKCIHAPSLKFKTYKSLVACCHSQMVLEQGFQFHVVKNLVMICLPKMKLLTHHVWNCFRNFVVDQATSGTFIIYVMCVQLASLEPRLF